MTVNHTNDIYTAAVAAAQGIGVFRLLVAPNGAGELRVSMLVFWQAQGAKEALFMQASQLSSALCSFALTSLALIVAMPGAAMAQTQSTSVYRNTDYRFEVIFPEAPMERDVSYETRDGANVTARQFYVERGTNQYHVTVVNLPDGPPIDADAVEYAAEQSRQLGEVRFQYEVAYDPGIPGWQLNVLHNDGRQVRATIYMWDHNLYITRAMTARGDTAALMLDQSIFLLNADGTEVDTGRGNAPTEVAQ
ncbi:MAG: hypothetical protein V3S07_04425 [Micropepsaceae bacterium]